MYGRWHSADLPPSKSVLGNFAPLVTVYRSMGLCFVRMELLVLWCDGTD
jgi:hypothetical protein